MKILLTAAAAATAVLLAAAPALADPAASDTSAITTYGTLGYTDFNADSANLGAITARLGARFGRYFGAEGELSGGVTTSHVNVGGLTDSVRINDQAAIYGVGFLPVAPNADLFARVGYGQTNLHVSGPASFSGTQNSWNYGVGGQYFFDGANGVRADYTRMLGADHAKIDSNVWALAYVRKF
jgi:outer membrane immunogenic protein